MFLGYLDQPGRFPLCRSKLFVQFVGASSVSFLSLLSTLLFLSSPKLYFLFVVIKVSKIEDGSKVYRGVCLTDQQTNRVYSD